MAENDLDFVIAEQNLIEDNWNNYKKEMIRAALNACEKHGYPTGDEPLCLIIEDTMDSTREYLTNLQDS